MRLGSMQCCCESGVSGLVFYAEVVEGKRSWETDRNAPRVNLVLPKL